MKRKEKMTEKIEAGDTLITGCLLQCFIGISVSNANSVEADQTPRCAASDQDLHCLLMSIFGGRWS